MGSMHRQHIAAAVLFLVVVAGCGSDDSNALEPDDIAALPPAIRQLTPLHKRLGKPAAGEWLAEHFELGQTYRQYVRGNPVRATPERRTLYIQPLGEFTAAQSKIVQLTAEYMGLYFGLPVKTCDGLSLDVVPQGSRRKPSPDAEQILTGYVLTEVLPPRLPDDAVAMIAFTAADLWPGEGWNYVFGQASLRDRVGVWSIHRFGNPSASDDAFKLCLRRTLKTATHETGHMFSMSHCTLYNCLMCGSNHLAEADRRPMEPCPQCLAKLCHATGVDPAGRFRGLVEFHKANGLQEEQSFCEKSRKVVETRR